MIAILISFLAAGLLGQRGETPESAVESVLKRLSSSDLEAQRTAVEALEKLRITPAVGVRLIHAAGETYPNERQPLLDINENLLRPLWKWHREEPAPGCRG